MIDRLKLGKRNINISDIRDVSLYCKKVDISKDIIASLQSNFNYLGKRSENEVIYGLNTGFGPMAHVFIPKDKQIELQYNLIRSHAVGLGEHMSVSQVRSIMLVRLQTLLKSHSGVTVDVCNLLATFLNKEITPLVYKHGSVGASGDLVQLAHIAEALIGEGRVIYKGEIKETKDVFKSVLEKEGVFPITVSQREGLALINGTASMSGIGAMNVQYAKNLVQSSVLASALLFEIVEASEDYYSKEISSVRPHQGQIKVGELFRTILKSSKRTRITDIRKINQTSGSDTLLMQQSRQEIYSIRCAVQILGPIFEELMNATKVVEIEMNSVTDNPISFTNSKIIHGGNFHGDYVSYEMDKLKIAITKLSMFSERKLNFLVNDKINNMFPPFLNKGVVGLDLGLQGLQFVATSTVAENQSLSMPVSVHSITCNNDNQDIVSMGTNSALIAEKVIMNTFDVVAIELMALVRAVDNLKIENKLSRTTCAFYRDIKRCITSKSDLVKHDDVQGIVDLLKGIEADLF